MDRGIRTPGFRRRRTIAWLLGRGAAMSCGFAWEVPAALYQAFRAGALPRAAFVERVRQQLRAFQEARYRACAIRHAPFEQLAALLAREGAAGDEHAFMTTNWDTVVDRALAPYGHFVWHLNGCIEPGHGALLLEDDAREQFEESLDSPPYHALARAPVRILAGISLESPLDRALIERLRQRPAPRGAAWCLVNEAAADLGRLESVVRACCPGVQVVVVRERIEAWVAAGMPELRELGVLREAARRRQTTPR